MTLDESNYIGIVDVAKHCDMSKLRIAENNALEYDLREGLCDIWEDVKRLDESDLLMTGNDDFGGILKIWALFSYARYVENSIYTDTGSGFVRKDHSNSMPVMRDELKDISKQHRNMAFIEIDRLYYHLCTTNYFKSGKCECRGKKCDGKRKAALFSKTSTNINRKGWNVTR